MIASLRYTTDMTLSALLNSYLESRECSPRYRESLMRTVRKAEISGLVEICQLSPERVNRLLNGLTVGATTKANIRRELLTLWRYAYEEGMTEVFPARITRIRPKHTPPQAWSLPDLSRLLQAAQQDEHAIGGVTRLRVCDVMPAWIGIAYDTGLRFSDVLNLRLSNIRNGCISTVANKTGKPLVRRMSEGTEQCVAELAERSPDGTLFLWAVTRRRACKTWRAFLDRHGFEGSSKWLRRSCATYIEQQQPGAATAYLQHSNPTLAARHYLDASLFGVPTGPPPIQRQRSASRPCT